MTAETKEDIKEEIEDLGHILGCPSFIRPRLSIHRLNEFFERGLVKKRAGMGNNISWSLTTEGKEHMETWKAFLELNM